MEYHRYTIALQMLNRMRAHANRRLRRTDLHIWINAFEQRANNLVSQYRGFSLQIHRPSITRQSFQLGDPNPLSKVSAAQWTVPVQRLIFTRYFAGCCGDMQQTEDGDFGWVSANRCKVEDQIDPLTCIRVQISMSSSVRLRIDQSHACCKIGTPNPSTCLSRQQLTCLHCTAFRL